MNEYMTIFTCGAKNALFLFS